jgi:hypothetical protein
MVGEPGFHFDQQRSKRPGHLDSSTSPPKAGFARTRIEPQIDEYRTAE